MALRHSLYDTVGTILVWVRVVVRTRRATVAFERARRLVQDRKAHGRRTAADRGTYVRTYVRTCSTSCPNSTDPHYVSEGIPLNETQQI
jgi:hypothetical protein